MHLLFVNDVVFGEGSNWEWRSFERILKVFCLATSMVISVEKSLLLCNRLSEEVENHMYQMFPYKIGAIENELKYLGCFLKPNDYKVDHWGWLLRKVEERINIRCHSWLSLEGRLVLVKSVMESISIYWLSLVHVPKSILDKIRSCFKLLWSNKK